MHACMHACMHSQMTGWQAGRQAGRQAGTAIHDVRDIHNTLSLRCIPGHESDRSLHDFEAFDATIGENRAPNGTPTTKRLSRI